MILQINAQFASSPVPVVGRRSFVRATHSTLHPPLRLHQRRSSVHLVLHELDCLQQRLDDVQDVLLL